jgi:TIGR03009 family protein
MYTALSTSRSIALVVVLIWAARHSAYAQLNTKAVQGPPQATTPAQQQQLATQAPFQLTANEQKRMDQILGFWEVRSSKVKTYQCKFTRWEYDPVFGPPNPRHAKTVSHGAIKYAAPDKGMFQVTAAGQFTAPGQEGGQPSYPMDKVENGEHWMCNGQSIFEFNADKKQLVETSLPPELQGNAITEGPLPFLFGAKADQLKARYWFREEQPPAGSKGEYWLWAYPKRREDAANFRQVRVILDEEMFLPTALEMHLPNGKSRTTYTFDDRKVNDLVNNVRDFMNSFIRPSTPLGWQKIVENYHQPAPEPQRVAPARGRASQALLPAQPGRN